MRLSVKLCALAVAFGLCGIVVAQVPAPQTYEITSVSVEGNRNVDARVILAAASLRTGDKIAAQSEQLQLAVRRLQELRLFSHVSVVVASVAGPAISLVIRVTEFPRLRKYTLSGNDDVSESDTRKKIALYPGDVLTDATLFRIRRDLTKLCEEEGHLRAEVETNVTPADSGTNMVNLAVVLKEGPAVKIGAITFTGNTAFDGDKLRGQLEETKEKSWWQFWRSSKFDRKKFVEDEKHLVEFYHREGFLDAQVVHDTISYTEGNTRLNVQITVSEGERFHVRNIAVSGNGAFPTEEIVRRLNFKRGDVYNTEKFDKNLRSNDDQTDVSSLYFDNGYLACQIDKEENRIGRDSVDIMIHIVERNQFRVREVSITGNTKTYDKVVRRELYSLPGDYFSRGAIIRSLRQLSVLNFFNPEKLRPDTHIVDATRVDIAYHVEERSSDTFNASVGYSGSFGVTASIGLTFNNFSLGTLFSEPFKYGAGQQLNFVYERSAAASSLNTFTIGFTEPWLWDTPTSLGFSLFDTRQVYTNYQSSRYGFSISLGRRFRFPDDFFRGDWTLQAQKNNVSVSNGYYRTGITNQVSVSQMISRSSIDNGIFPTTGSRVAWLIQAAVPFDSSFVGYHKNKFTFEFYTPLARIAGQNRLVLYTVADFGFMKEFKAGNVVNLIDFFFMGGNGLTGIPTVPLRGYIDQSVGPQNAGGQALGGRIYSKYGMEARFAVSLDPIPIYLLAFAEAGNVWADLNSVDPFGLKRGAGFGARLLINPIGLLGFDEGYGFDSGVPGGPPSGWNFHFQFGRGF